MCILQICVAYFSNSMFMKGQVIIQNQATDIKQNSRDKRCCGSLSQLCKECEESYQSMFFLLLNI